MANLSLTVNGKARRIANGSATLLEVLRDELGLTGAKRGCNQGVCGTCTVLINGRAARACLSLAGMLGGAAVTTAEGLSPPGELSHVQQAFVDAGAVQCGFCMPGMVVAATALLSENPSPSDAEIREGLGGNLCRCSGYVKVVEAVRNAAVAARGKANPTHESTKR
jgi:aerobic-type carbon monoxide dehydrogenase small subunit (CoxS/CutS family)